MTAKVRIGFVGAGFMGQLAHIRSYARLDEGCELVALAEPRRRTAELVAARYGIGRVYRDHRELLESEELDGIVAVQRYVHHATLLPGLYPRVRHLFTEKPLALGAEEGDRLARLAAENGCVHMLGYQRRSDPATREAKRTVDAWKATGEMGALRYLRICYSDGDWTGNSGAALVDPGEEPPPFAAEDPPPEVAADEEALWALSIAADQLVHPLNLIRHFLGERYGLVFVHASGRLLVFESESGVPATIEVTPYRLTVGFDEEILVAFERGYVRLRPAPSLALNRSGALQIYRDPGQGAAPERIEPQLPWIDPQQAQAGDFLRVCRGEAAPPTDAAEAAEDLRLVRDIVLARLELPGGREAVRAEREEHMRAWQERVRSWKGGD
ncbi:MAG TPA: Gfo/Idh/MocA family oxidoreductase [Gaiellaceae bacterium]|nr:Gfo/Idh/MocA family oxidoreductase [Gaiellaceae bacterium]